MECDVVIPEMDRATTPYLTFPVAKPNTSPNVLLLDYISGKIIGLGFFGVFFYILGRKH